MRIKMSFLGAVQNVTGSRYLVESNGTRLMLPGENFDKAECVQVWAQNQGYRVEALTNFEDTIHWLSKPTAFPH